MSLAELEGDTWHRASRLCVLLGLGEADGPSTACHPVLILSLRILVGKCLSSNVFISLNLKEQIFKRLVLEDQS